MAPGEKEAIVWADLLICLVIHHLSLSVAERAGSAAADSSPLKLFVGWLFYFVFSSTKIVSDAIAARNVAGVA